MADDDEYTHFIPPKPAASADDEGEATLVRPSGPSLDDDPEATQEFHPEDIPQAGEPSIQREEWSFEQLAAHVEANPRRIYAILDSADEPRVWDKVDELGYDRALSLFNGVTAFKYKKIAPYLVIVDANLLQWIKNTLWEDFWGVFVESGLEFRDLRKHLHTKLMATFPDGSRSYFRYYDPRCLIKMHKSNMLQLLLAYEEPLPIQCLLAPQKSGIIKFTTA